MDDLIDGLDLLKKKKKGRELEKGSEDENRDEPEGSGLFEELDLDLNSDLPVREKQSKSEKKVRKVRE